MPRLLCPYCLKPHDFGASDACQTDPELKVPRAYIQHYHQAPPLWLVTIGFPRHGKTTYLAALSLLLENVSWAWPEAISRYLDSYTFETIRTIRREATEGISRPATQLRGSVLKTPPPLLIQLRGMRGIGSRCLALYDLPGELFEKLDELEKYVAVVREVRTIWFLVSVDDLLGDKKGRSLKELFDIYHKAMDDLRIDLDGRNLVVVFTKGDQRPAAVEVKNYLRDDPFQQLNVPGADLAALGNFSLAAYRGEMERMSGFLEDYTRKHVPGGAAFVASVRGNGLSLHFCVLSALGDNPDDEGRLAVEASRYRVLDPLFWAAALEERTDKRSVALIVDTAEVLDEAYRDGALEQLWQYLARDNEILLYYLGSQRARGQSGQQPLGTPPRRRHQRLIGPILDRLPADCRAIAITSGRLLDLQDFAQTSWKDRLIVLELDDEIDNRWPHRETYRPSEDPARPVDILRGLAAG